MEVNNRSRKPAVNERRHGVPYKGQQHKSDLIQHTANPEHAAHCCWTNDVICNTNTYGLHSAYKQSDYGCEYLWL